MSRVHVGTSGFSYPTWKPGFYPAGTPQGAFLQFYAERFDTVELNTTGYRLPDEDRFRHWAEQVPEGFRFAVKMPHPNRLAAFTERVRVLGDKLGPVRIVVQQARDDDFLSQLLESLDPSLRWAFDFRHESWAGAETGLAAVVDSLDGAASFRYVRLREPPYDDAALRGWADRLRPQIAEGVELFVYFRHEDEPTAPAYAQRLVQLLASG